MTDKDKELDKIIAKASAAATPPTAPAAPTESGVETREELNEKLRAYQNAIASEFAITNDAETAKTQLSEYFRANANTAAEEIVHLSTNADKESTRLAACKYIIDHAYQSSEEIDGLSELMKQLTTKPQNEAPTN